MWCRVHSVVDYHEISDWLIDFISRRYIRNGVIFEATEIKRWKAFGMGLQSISRLACHWSSTCIIFHLLALKLEGLRKAFIQILATFESSPENRGSGPNSRVAISTHERVLRVWYSKRPNVESTSDFQNRHQIFRIWCRFLLNKFSSVSENLFHEFLTAFH